MVTQDPRSSEDDPHLLLAVVSVSSLQSRHRCGGRGRDAGRRPHPGGAVAAAGRVAVVLHVLPVGGVQAAGCSQLLQPL